MKSIIKVSSIHKSYEWFFEIVAEKFLPHFEGRKKYEISINEECDHLGEYDDHNNTPKEKK